jgi:hypothetical protein
MFTFTKRLLLILGLVFCLIAGYSQPITVATQNFDGGGSQTAFTATGSWVNDATYYSSGTNSIHADVPFMLNAEAYYISSVIDISPTAFPPNGFEFVKLRFKHICKVSPLDTVRVQYKLDVPGATWTDLPSAAYEGTATNYGTRGFNAGSYSIWNAEDSLVNPDNLCLDSHQ